ncbi:class I SAM-dependent methyltransferase [Amycolatopsis sp. WAC 04197]|uniref:class I SAM-dependent methyltransferase n=1 Tax=Amycolatopsis sp. WAC 04197 TaxID=2203199 RepID=UPI0013157A66|nr:class I SAM-dependent methyltransferase [Amycolatopsis sp. WAC 04197]
MFDLDKLTPALRRALACPACHGGLARTSGGLRCAACANEYPANGEYPDFAPEMRMKSGLGPFYLQDPLHVPHYEAKTRVAFLEIMGGNWDGAVTPEVEDDYLRGHLGAGDAPLLDLACGAGRWTRTLAGHLGSDQVIGLDLGRAMLTSIRAALPEVPVIRASALALPFADGSLGGVNCSNALQLLPDPRAVLFGAGRCLRPGGVFTAFTFLRSESPARRYFQHRHERTFNVRSFTAGELITWLDSAGLALTDLTTEADMVFLTARRRRL